LPSIQGLASREALARCSASGYRTIIMARPTPSPSLFPCPPRLVLGAPGDKVGGALLLPAGSPRALVACIHGGGCHSGYFESGEPSLAAALRDAGHAVLLINRPGTGGRPLLDPDRPLAASIDVIADFVGRSWRNYVPDVPVALVGHSIGAALALSIAAAAPDWPLAAVAVSGIGDELPPLVIAWPRGRDQAPSTEAAGFFLGPEGTYDWRGLTRLRKVAAPWNVAERLEVVNHWPARWRELAPRIRVPVQIRLADGERIWVTGEHVVQRMAAALDTSPAVDAAILPDGGHLYEFHKRGHELIAEQVAFLGRVMPII
jgi:pimeloyl-ACP methyl ester carboxylesterase